MADYGVNPQTVDREVVAYKAVRGDDAPMWDDTGYFDTFYHEDYTDCPACGFRTFDGERCGHCIYTEEYGPCPGCGTYRGFDGSRCERCFYHGPYWTNDRWTDRLRWWARDIVHAIRTFRQRRAHRLGPDEELPF